MRGHGDHRRQDGRIGLHRAPVEKEPAQFGYLDSPQHLRVLEAPATKQRPSKLPPSLAHKARLCLVSALVRLYPDDASHED